MLYILVSLSGGIQNHSFEIDRLTRPEVLIPQAYIRCLSPPAHGHSLILPLYRHIQRCPCSTAAASQPVFDNGHVLDRLPMLGSLPMRVSSFLLVFHCARLWQRDVVVLWRRVCVAVSSGQRHPASTCTMRQLPYGCGNHGRVLCCAVLQRAGLYKLQCKGYVTMQSCNASRNAKLQCKVECKVASGNAEKNAKLKLAMYSDNAMC